MCSWHAMDTVEFSTGLSGLVVVLQLEAWRLTTCLWLVLRCIGYNASHDH